MAFNPAVSHDRTLFGAGCGVVRRWNRVVVWCALGVSLSCSDPATTDGDIDQTGGTAGGGSSGSPSTAGSGNSGSGNGGSAGMSVGGAGAGGVLAGNGGSAGGGATGGGSSGAGGLGLAGSGGTTAGSAGTGAIGGQGGMAGSAGGVVGTGGFAQAGAGAGGVTGGAGGTGGAGSGGMAGSSFGGAGTGGQVGGGTGGAMGGAAGKGGSGSCEIPSPPSEMVETINLTWKEMTGGFQGLTGARPTSASILSFRNSILDQLFAAGGSLNFCVRWESTATVSATVRDQIAAALDRGVNEWFSRLVGHNCFPYSSIPVKVVGWATRDRDLLDWPDGVVPIYVNDIRENAPQCAEACGRFFHQQAGYTYPQCAGGIANHYDMSLWLTQGMGGGAGGDWGQRVGSEYFVNSLGSQHQHIWLHEFGHGLGFPDYYEWDTWAPNVDSPNSVMVAGRASLVTDWDTWMVRHLWNNMKSRFP